MLTCGSDVNPLRVYLTEMLKVLPNSSKSQRTMVCTWLCELYLHMISVSQLGVASPSSSSSSSSAAASGGSVAVAAAASAAIGRDRAASTATTTGGAGAGGLLSEGELTAQFKDILRSNK
jgi:hypothetical protein